MRAVHCKVSVIIYKSSLESRVMLFGLSMMSLYDRVYNKLNIHSVGVVSARGFLGTNLIESSLGCGGESASL